MLSACTRHDCQLFIQFFFSIYLLKHICMLGNYMGCMLLLHSHCHSLIYTCHIYVIFSFFFNLQMEENGFSCNISICSSIHTSIHPLYPYPIPFILKWLMLLWLWLKLWNQCLLTKLSWINIIMDISSQSVCEIVEILLRLWVLSGLGIMSHCTTTVSCQFICYIQLKLMQSNTPVLQ